MSSLGNKEIMAKNIKYYMALHDVNQKDICTTLKIPSPTFSDWVNAKTYPRIDKIEMLANYFGISKADLVEERGLQGEIIKTSKLPVIGRVSAGNGVLAYDEILDYEFAEERYCNDKHFFLQVVGDSMSPKIEDGDRVLVHKQDFIDSGNYAVVLVDDEEGCVKVVKYGKDWIELHSINPYYPVRRFEKADTQKIRIIGKVLKVIRTL